MKRVLPQYLLCLLLFNRRFFRFEDMLSLKVEKTEADSSDKALAWVLGALAANADSVSICSGQPCPRQ